MSHTSIDEIDAKIAEIKQRIANEPQRIQDEHDRRMNTIPANDEAVEQLYENEHEDQLTQNEVENIRIKQSQDATILILLIAALAALSIWIYRTYESFQ